MPRRPHEALPPAHPARLGHHRDRHGARPGGAGAPAGASVAVLLRRRVSPHRGRRAAGQLRLRRLRSAGARRLADPRAARAALFGIDGARHAALASRARGHRPCRLGRASAPDESVLMRRLLIAALAIVPSGCERAAADAQLAAKVNGTEISLRHLRTTSPGNLQQVLEKVIDRELLVQKALEAGLERDPQLGESIDAARRQLLAQAYIDKVSASVQKSSREEVHAFYAENPVLFAERRIYRMRELVVSAPAELIDVLRAESARAAGLEQEA